VGKGNQTVSIATNLAGKISEITLGEGLNNNLRKIEEVSLSLLSIYSLHS